MNALGSGLTECSVEVCTKGGKIIRGLCSMHYMRLKRRGVTDGRHIPSLSTDLMITESGCLEWTGGTNDQGYGYIKVAGKRIYTHRQAWIVANGPIPKGLCVLHHCDNPPCCQTDPTEGYPEGHLFLGTKAENNADKVAKGRNRTNGSEKWTHCHQGHEFTEANTYLWQGHRHCRACRRLAHVRHRLKQVA